MNIQRINTKNLASFTLLITFLCGPKVNSCKHVLRLARHCTFVYIFLFQVMSDSLVMWDSGVVDIYVASCGIRGTLLWDKTELAALPPKNMQFVTYWRPK